jgi:hypothetical protein
LKKVKKIKTDKKNKRFQWLPALLIIWNLIDLVLHVAIDMAEPLRITGNIVGIAAALIVLLGFAKSYAPHILGGAAVTVVALNALHASEHGFAIPMLVFIGVALFLLLRWAQVKSLEAYPESENAVGRFYHRWWMALLAALVGVGIVTLSGPRVDMNPLALLHNGELEGTDYWSDEPMILSAGLGFDNIVGLPELTEETVREAGGSWYGSVTCPSGEEPTPVDYTSASSSDQVSQFFKGFSEYDDGLPIVFSWPVASETVDITDFQFTLKTG